MSSQPSNAPRPPASGPNPSSAEAAQGPQGAQAAPAGGPQSETTAKRNTQKLQRAAVDGLEDVKAQDIRVFNTEALSALFERVIIASGSSNRQTKALAASVCDAVREAGFDKPRVEGEDNGEWIVVDCGPVVVHVMQPTIRQYYRLEEIWGSKPVRLKLGAPAPTQVRPAAAVGKAKAKPAKADQAATLPSAKAKPAAARAKPAKPAKYDEAQAAPARAKAVRPAAARAKPVKPAKASAIEPAAATPAKQRPARPRTSPKPKPAA
ncbi:ribosome silencing factor [Serpentinimonas barnesii]|uniref:ribosome silencing factor n=1 Tax=Serpentinimonas barnesii TaxID=1458427 RepID=UPI0009E362FE|nr:ribosome silencing factor [Serpentinimonas barnesii]